MRMTIEGVNTPIRKTDGSCGYDIYAPCDMDIELIPKTYDLGIMMETGDIPLGYYALIFPRSSTGGRGLVLANTSGVIDSDYTMDTIKATLFLRINNAIDPETNTIEFSKSISFKKNDRILQMIITPFRPIPSEIEPIEKRKGGYGSTGL